MILQQASESTAETPDTAEAPTETEGEVPGHNQHPPISAQLHSISAENLSSNF